MGAFNHGTYRSPKDILDRQSRPQHHSTWVGGRRDWRYRTGVFRHTDHEDSPRDRTIWDKLDYAIYEDPHQMRSSEPEVLSRDAQIESESEDDSDADTPERIALYRPTLSRALKDPSQSQREMINHMLPSPPSSSEAPVPPSKPILVETPRIPEPTNILQTSRVPRTESSRETWHDSTRDFNMLTVRTTLRPPNEASGGLVRNYSWYADATPVDALLPPGVPLSIKEICIYYPHHVRWQDIMLRLTHNDYRGQDILGAQAFFRGTPQDHITPSAMNQLQRDTVMRFLPDFKTIGYEGKGDANVYTDQLKPGAYLEKKFKGYTLPTFDDLVRGLSSLPKGPDAGPLTQCLNWYLSVCNTFTPKLELNVLHAQALIRALRQPTIPVGMANLNRLALEQWREDGTFPGSEIAALVEDTAESERHPQQPTRPKASFNIRPDPIQFNLEIDLPIRHILTFPFLALHGVVAEAFTMGIHKAESRKALRSSKIAPRKRARDAVSVYDDTPRDTIEGTEPDNAESVRPPKRRRVFEDGSGASLLRTPK